jgi:5'-nucleotidase
MPFPIEDKLVVAIASSALFDLSESDRIYREKGTEAYRAYQREHENEVLAPGVAFAFIRRLLGLEGSGPTHQPVEVILLSRNDPDTGLRVFNSIEAHHLRISRAAFTRGRLPYPYVDSFNACLFLSANGDDVQKAIAAGLPAGRVLPSTLADDPADRELRIAFDFDGVIADDEAEKVFQAGNIDEFFESEVVHAQEALKRGPLNRLLSEVARLQRVERARAAEDSSYTPFIRTAIVTSRNAPAHKRVVTTLRAWEIEVDEVFFLGGMDKRRILNVLKPHIFFDDQMAHAGPAAGSVPSVHVPFGITNESKSNGASGSRLLAAKSPATKARRSRDSGSDQPARRRRSSLKQASPPRATPTGLLRRRARR